MDNLVSAFVVLQIILLFVITLHDWIHLPPFTDIRAFEKLHSKKDRLIGSTINGITVLIPLILTLMYRNSLSTRVVASITVFYGILSLGTIASWWIPYFFGSSAEHKKGFSVFRNTHIFLPKRNDNVVPNTFHVILHLLIWSCLGIALYLALN